MLMFIMWHINGGNNLSDKTPLFCFAFDFARNFIKYNKGVIIRGLKAIKSDKGEEGVWHFCHPLYSNISHVGTNCSPCLAQLGVWLWR